MITGYGSWLFKDLTTKQELYLAVREGEAIIVHDFHVHRFQDADKAILLAWVESTTRSLMR